MMIKLLIGILVGAAVGALLGYFGSCSSGTCPLTANPLRGAVFGAVLGALFTFPSGFRQPLPDGGAPHITSQQQLQAVIDSQKPCLIDFYSERCAPCRRLIPVIDRMAVDYEGRAGIYKVNIGRSPDPAEAFQIHAIPTVVFFKNGEEVERMTGLRPRESYENALNQLIEQDDYSEKQDEN